MTPFCHSLLQCMYFPFTYSFPDMKTLALTLTLLASVTAARADWPLFRGPNGNGIANTMTLPAKIDTNSIAWAADLPGRGLSSPIIIGDRVFVTSASGPKQERLHVI